MEEPLEDRSPAPKESSPAPASVPAAPAVSAAPVAPASAAHAPATSASVADTAAAEAADPQDGRPSWDEYFMTLATQVATRTTCLRRAVGALIVKDRRILATGYNGVPTGIAHCAQTGCLRQQLGIPSGQRHEMCRGLHAEQNAIIQAARYGINITGASIYITTQPCVVCAKMLINAGIVEIVYQNPYPDELAMSLLDEAGILVRVFDPAAKRGASPLPVPDPEDSLGPEV